MEPQLQEQKSGRAWIERLIKLAPIFLAMATAAFFLNGRAFRAGYVAHFKLNSTMFDDDISGLVTISVRAWLEVIAHILHAVASLPTQGIWVVLVMLLGPLMMGGLIRLWSRWTCRRRRRRARKLRREGLHAWALKLRRYINRNLLLRRPPAWLIGLRRTLWGLWFMGYLTYLGLAFTAIIILSLLIPFERVGAEIAAKDQADHFRDQPLVVLKGPDGQAAPYRVILCASRFCALYSDSKAITVPVSAITWGVSTLDATTTTTGSEPAVKHTADVLPVPSGS